MTTAAHAATDVRTTARERKIRYVEVACDFPDGNCIFRATIWETTTPNQAAGLAVEEARRTHPSAEHIYLDPAGRTLDSEGFSRIFEKAEMIGRDLVFLVGGADGLPAACRSGGAMLLSLSAMTFPHELARAMLAEQIYRAFAILRGHPYPR